MALLPFLPLRPLRPGSGRTGDFALKTKVQKYGNSSPGDSAGTGDRFHDHAQLELLGGRKN